VRRERGSYRAGRPARDSGRLDLSLVAIGLVMDSDPYPDPAGLSP
jgi:hypothetical protein